jgi:hypothetical protein
MLRFAAVLVLGFAGLGAINPRLAWIYVVFAAAFEAWLAARLRAEGARPAAAGTPPYHFSEEEAAFIGRFRFYFTYPALARDAAGVMAALGLSGLLLAPWLTYRGAYAQAILAGVNLFAVAAFTKRLAPLLTLRIRASKGDQAALRLLGLHDPLWAKIRAGNSGDADPGAPPEAGS